MVFLLDLGSFTNLVISVYVLKIQKTKLAHILEIDCFLRCNNQFCFCWKINVRLGVWFLLDHPVYRSSLLSAVTHCSPIYSDTCVHVISHVFLQWLGDETIKFKLIKSESYPKSTSQYRSNHCHMTKQKKTNTAFLFGKPHTPRLTIYIGVINSVTICQQCKLFGLIYQIVIRFTLASFPDLATTLFCHYKQ